MSASPYEHDAREALAETTVLSEEERAAIDVTQLRAFECITLAHALREADEAMHAIFKARSLVHALMAKTAKVA